MTCRSITLGLLLAALSAPFADAADPMLDQALRQPVSTLDYGMLRLERALEARLSAGAPGHVMRGNFGPREHTVSVRLDEDGRTILIQPIVRAYEYFDDSKCEALIDDVRSVLVGTDASRPDDAAIATFFESAGGNQTWTQTLARQLMDRITIRAALVTHAVGDEEPALTYCEAPLRSGRTVHGR